LKKKSNALSSTTEWFQGTVSLFFRVFFTALRYYSFIKKKILGPGEMAQRLRALADLPEVLSSIPTTT